MATFEDVQKVIEKELARGAIDIHFNGPVEEEVIKAAETRLGVMFPTSYRKFIARYGGGYFGTFLFECLRMSDPTVTPSLISHTEELRTEGYIPNNIIPIYREDEMSFMIDLSVSEAGESPVISWLLGLEAHLQPRQYTFLNFADFFLDCYKIALEIED